MSYLLIESIEQAVTVAQSLVDFAEGQRTRATAVRDTDDADLWEDAASHAGQAMDGFEAMRHAGMVLR